LLNEYKSTHRIQKAGITELAALIGLSKAQLVYKALNKKEDQN
jgi:ERCC4-type nuclease